MFFLFFFVTAVILFGVLCLTAFMAFQVRHSNHSAKNMPKKDTASLCVVLGSGGHTSEMMELVKHFGEEFDERTYIIADTDTMSEDKAINHEKSRNNEKFCIEKIPRSREVGQSYLTSIGSTINATAFAVKLIYRIRPDLIVLNGPGTCIPVALAAAFFDIIRLIDTVIIYEESICRVKKLSLSGAILYYLGMVDCLIVHWPGLKKSYPRATYIQDLEHKFTLDGSEKKSQ
ncbi:UDP-N-acetylglucosamine transferase subunit ALG14 [Caenorhabditis elegans]|uniref:UDP-N-acetylglucosamine transferase subunit ALG14 n=1 Tax=Caenorhabditis elegans TaxID=6239 RepID=U4PQW2_CAEEL|nr:UDP-N-acetylglucosamine transferase subunit ALG14 homolog [Caenorhabditis elegans]CDH92983.1 UDP-N-acetylglucosamine transferase subunit ALG14 homolog [Caenorhabditis elegans]|eukprot:NP_001294286.1 Asparagine Linked Glycosylation (ALG) homolog, Nematode [Caenorhabditis elegans]